MDDRKYKSILCLNGDFPKSDFFSSGLPIIAADGAVNTLHAMGIVPHVVVGDLDSAEISLLQKSRVIYCPDQNSSDFEKCLQYMHEKDLLPAIVTGVNGGSLDHVLNNVSLFLQQDCLLYAPPLTGFVLRPQEKQLCLPVGTKLSLLGFPEACMSSSGMWWELDQHVLAFPGRNSCFNRTRQEVVSLNVHAGTVLVLVYHQKNLDGGCMPASAGDDL